MKLLLPFKCSRLDFSSLTAKPSTVRKGKTFLGEGSQEVLTGELEEVAAVVHELPLNGRYLIPPGIHGNGSKVQQSMLSLMDEIIIYPTGENQVVRTKNKYMSGDIYLAELVGLTPENIKKDVTILGEKGIYEGYS